MDFKTRTLQELRAARGMLASRRTLLGFDGFVDTIVTPVALRASQGENFTPFAGIAEFGQRIVGAAGKSTNIELYPRMDKLGGNGPIMANALLAQGARVTYVGALGEGTVHPVFADLAQHAEVISLCAPAHTVAAEFNDGKIMLGLMRSLDEITPEKISAVLGADGYRDALARSDLVALVNWTMIPNLTAVFTDLVERVLPQTPVRPGRLFFFDLCDPEKRSRADLAYALATIAKFEQFGRVTLGLNLKEAQQVHATLGFAPLTEAEEGLRQMAADIRQHLDLTTVVVHPKESAACATRDATHWVPGPYVAQPLITTGAGDHFNAGFTAGQLIGLSPESCLGVGVCTSGHYVRTARSPSHGDLETFLANWQ
ncbi:carbohydrate kinase family protein [Horticoccus luteus]|uniref:Carbohydrate kinase family protein n=1 Tax=Horticoccus luteus TaxID=2862869 RepID=A0A8F9XK23_9BACT|nr:PfkB family carbohydrate kinase [Horticoccus luteus]QYM77756.1 carbohydrate kinase family protein [Horticoccus luteus]